MDSIARFILNPDLIFPKIDTMHLLISDAAITDSFRTLDYHYTISDFHNGFTQKIDNHSPYGIKPFIDRRRSSILKLTDTNEPIVRDANYLFRMVYNSMTHTIEIETDLEITNMELYNVEGCRLFNSKLFVFDKHISVKLPVIETRNIYIVRFISKNITISKLELFK